ncbi:MAG: hypothetical protein SPJ04_06515 [Bdellovibrionota bacterium]|nr:hypothetical protein [Pseudomonadota bacterium]MDY6090889.1 hypothetical protein [Bdellovibrionota bacterium]
MLEKLNSIFVNIFNFILIPVSNFSDEVKILYISILSGIIFLLIYGKVSNQKGIKETKRKIMAKVIEVALFRHSIKVCLNAQGALFKQGFKYLSFALIPLLILMVPCILIMAQINFHFQNRGLLEKEDAIIELSLDDPDDLTEYELKASSGTLSPALRVDDELKIIWKYKNNNGTNLKDNVNLELTLDDLSLNIPLSIDGKKPSLLTYSRDFFEGLLFPSKFKVSKDFKEIKSISIKYPNANQTYLGVTINWLWVFLIVSILSGLIASKVFKIEI